MNLSSRVKITNEKSRPTARHCATTRNEVPRCCQGKPDRSRLAPTSWTLERCTPRPFFPLLLLSARTDGTTISTSSLIRPDEICVLPSFPLPLPRFVSCCRWPFFCCRFSVIFFFHSNTHIHPRTCFHCAASIVTCMHSMVDGGPRWNAAESSSPKHGKAGAYHRTSLSLFTFSGANVYVAEKWHTLLPVAASHMCTHIGIPLAKP